MQVTYKGTGAERSVLDNVVEEEEFGAIQYVCLL